MTRVRASSLAEKPLLPSLQEQLPHKIQTCLLMALLSASQKDISRASTHYSSTPATTLQRITWERSMPRRAFCL